VNGNDALQIAACSGRGEVIKQLLETGQFDVNEGNKRGRTPLGALVSGWEDQVDFDLNDDPWEDAIHPERQIERQQRAELYSRAAEILIEAGADWKLPEPLSCDALLKPLTFFLNGLCDTDKAVPSKRRCIGWAITVTKAQDAISESMVGVAFQPTSPDELAAKRDARLILLREDAWKRRRHLCLDRALWRKPVVESEKPKEARAGAGE
jgi:hypothetical protein